MTRTEAKILIRVTQSRDGEPSDSIVAMSVHGDWSTETISAFATRCADAVKSLIGLADAEVQYVVLDDDEAIAEGEV